MFNLLTHKISESKSVLEFGEVGRADQFFGRLHAD